eukprot:534629-Prymnesium_polylepis.2
MRSREASASPLLWKNGWSRTDSISQPSTKWCSRALGSGVSNRRSKSIALSCSGPTLPGPSARLRLASRLAPFHRASRARSCCATRSSWSVWSSERPVTMWNSTAPNDQRSYATLALAVDRAVCQRRCTQSECHFGRTEARTRLLETEALAESARAVKINELPRRAHAHDVERLEVGMNPWRRRVRVQVIERVHEVVRNLAHQRPLARREAL